MYEIYAVTDIETFNAAYLNDNANSHLPIQMADITRYENLNYFNGMAAAHATL